MATTSGAFDRIAAVAAEIFGVPIAIVSVVDTDRIWFKAHHGLDVSEIGREPGLCASAITGMEPWIVNDAVTDPRTLANPLVAGEFGLRFYAGAPLTTHDGFNLGTLCVIDRELEALAAPGGLVGDGFLKISDGALEVSAEGRLFVRNICMHFDRYLPGHTARPVFSRTI
jgi:hypothetical protein